MTKHITVELTDAQTAHFERRSQLQALSLEDLMREAIQRQVDYDVRFAAAVQEGLDAADRGEVIPHEEVVARMKRRHSEWLEGDASA